MRLMMELMHVLVPWGGGRAFSGSQVLPPFFFILFVSFMSDPVIYYANIVK